MLTIPSSPSPDSGPAFRANLARIPNGGTIQLQNTAYNLETPVVFPPGTRLVGEGPASQIVVTRDMGPGVAAISVDPRATQDSAVVFENFRLVRPVGRPALGVSPSQMDGLEPGSCSTVRNVSIYGFRAGLRIRQDHISCYNVKSSNNLYNCFYGDSPLSKGNEIFIGCWFDGPLLASIAVAGDNCIDGDEFIGGHLGFGPYGILRHAGDSVVGMMSGSSFVGTSFEAIGNGAIVDRSSGAGSGSDTINNCDIRQVGFMWANGADQPYRLASEPADFAIVGRNIQGLRYFGGSYPFAAGAVGVLDASVRVEGFWDCGHGGLPHNLVSRPGDLTVRVVQQGFDYAARPFISATTAKAGQLACWNGSYYTVEPMCGQCLPGGPPKRFAGVYLNDVGAGEVVMIALPGSKMVPALCEAVPFAGWPLYAVQGSPYLSPAENGKEMAISFGPGGSSGGSLMTVQLSGNVAA